MKEEMLELRKLYERFKERHGLSAIDIISEVERKEILIPSTIFYKELSTFESIVKYLKENLSLANREIAELISKSQKSVWQVYNSARRKFPDRFRVTKCDCYIPISAIKPSFTILESVVRYLREDIKMGFHEIAVILKRDERTIWTVYRRKWR